jgi:hypothetical protein
VVVVVVGGWWGGGGGGGMEWIKEDRKAMNQKGPHDGMGGSSCGSPLCHTSLWRVLHISASNCVVVNLFVHTCSLFPLFFVSPVLYSLFCGGHRQCNV